MLDRKLLDKQYKKIGKLDNIDRKLTVGYIYMRIQLLKNIDQRMMRENRIVLTIHATIG